MNIENNLVLCALMILTSSSETKGQINSLPAVVTPVTLLPEGVSTAYQLFPLVNGDPEPEPSPTTQATLHIVATHRDSLLQTESVTAAGGRDDIMDDIMDDIRDDEGETSSTQPPPRVSTLIQTSVEPSNPAPSQPVSKEQIQTSRTGHVPAPANPPHQEDFPSELNIGDDDNGPPLPSTLDPLLASVVIVFIITTAVVSVVLFLKLRKRTSQPEFHRLQDLPMDDLMEDTPLSRYTYSY
ncbi:hypothetical protein DPEC_G00066930 [Dallia pectoralis]|uniref:Uncharacterized protein n=1 Tax=Dallia pectoralis TaxID=75939 RepID=A0ACC2H958_DALPE|nr:hypothetical protein DPEC_G00066930 [Dallia pectoralis]